MKLKHKLGRFNSILAVACCLLFTGALSVVGESPVWHYMDYFGPDGVFVPFKLPQVPQEEGFDWLILWSYQANQGEFFRTNRDGSVWWHTEANKAQFYIVYKGELLFTGYGHAMFEATVGQDYKADGHVIGCTIQAQMTELKTRKTSPFFLHWVVRDWVWIQDDVRFAPLGLEK
jgi:hypothetical protein